MHARDLVDAARRAVQGDGARRSTRRTEEAAAELRYRDHLTVALVVPQKHSFSDNWIYVHDPDVEVGRVQNYGSWSPFMVKDGRTCLGLEYFVNEGDGMWTKPDADLIEQGTRELFALGLIDDPSNGRGRLRRAHAEGVSRVRRALRGARRRRCASGSSANTPNVFPCGRNGMHKYNNQDHSMFTAMLSVENILGARPRRVGGQRRGRVPRAGRQRRDEELDRSRRAGAAAPRARRRGRCSRRRIEGGCRRRRVSPRTYRMLVRSGPTIRVWRDCAPSV